MSLITTLSFLSLGVDQSTQFQFILSCSRCSLELDPEIGNSQSLVLGIIQPKSRYTPYEEKKKAELLICLSAWNSKKRI